MGWIAAIVIWVVFIVGAVSLAWIVLRHRRWANSPERMLDERYARGEIEQDDYHERRRTLRSGR